MFVLEIVKFKELQDLLSHKIAIDICRHGSITSWKKKKNNSKAIQSKQKEAKKERQVYMKNRHRV